MRRGEKREGRREGKIPLKTQCILRVLKQPPPADKSLATISNNEGEIEKEREGEG